MRSRNILGSQIHWTNTWNSTWCIV